MKLYVSYVIHRNQESVRVCVRTPQWTSFQLYSDSESRAEAGTATQHTRRTDSRVRTISVCVVRTVSLDRAGITKRAAFTHS